jgi:hypothetical protein
VCLFEISPDEIPLDPITRYCIANWRNLLYTFIVPILASELFPFAPFSFIYKLTGWQDAYIRPKLALAAKLPNPLCNCTWLLSR